MTEGRIRKIRQGGRVPAAPGPRSDTLSYWLPITFLSGREKGVGRQVGIAALPYAALHVSPRLQRRETALFREA